MKLHLSYSSGKSKLTIRNEVVEVKAFQIIVWVSIGSDVHSVWDPRFPKLPAILDTGNNHNFALTRNHLVRWAGVQPASLPKLKRVRESGRRGQLHSAALWLHTDGDPCLLDIDEGVAVLDDDWPRLPILGLRALTNSKLQTFIYGDTKQVLIRTRPKWYWPF